MEPNGNKDEALRSISWFDLDGSTEGGGQYTRLAKHGTNISFEQLQPGRRSRAERFRARNGSVHPPGFLHVP